MQKNKLWLLLTIPAVLVLTIPAYGLIKFGVNCQSQYNSARKEKQPIIDQFNTLALLGEQPAQKASVTRGGDCIDSKPYVVVSKSYSTKTNGGEAVDAIRSSLKAAGYTITSQNFGQEGCKDLYRVKASSDHVKVYVVAYQEQKDPSCTSMYPKGISEAHFREQTIDVTKLTLN